MASIPTPRWLRSIREWILLLNEHMTAREKAFLSFLTIVLIVSAVFSVVGFVQRNSHLVPQTGGTYTEAAVGEPRHINPILAGANDLDLDVTKLVFSSLVTLDNDFNLQPDLATSFEVSEDGLIYTFHLREDVKWHDGEPFTAQDVVFTIRSIQTPDYGSPLESSFQGVTIEATDEKTVVLKLKQPYAPFLNNLTVGIVPKHVWESIAPKNASLAEQMLKPIGTGPFEFAELVTRRKTGEITSFKTVRNEEYYGQTPYLNEFTFLFFPSQEEATQALTAGNVDGLGFLPLSDASDINSRTAINSRRLLLPQTFGLFFNEVNNEILGNVGVRAALSLATDREEITTKALKGEAEPLHAPIPSGTFDFSDEFGEPSFDPETAKQNLEESDWKDEDGDGIREKDGERLEVAITTTDWPEFIETAELIKEQWGKIGVAVNIESYGAGVIQQTIVGPRDYEILLYGEILAADPDPYPFWHSTQTRNPGLNLSLFKDKNVDKLLEEARRTIDFNERREKYAEFQQIFLDLNPAIILYQPYYLFAHHRDVRGFTIDNVNLPSSRFNDVENWHVNVKRVWNGSGDNNE